MLKNQFPIAIPIDHPSYSGHFPGHPITPGVVLLDETLFVLDAALATTHDKRVLHTVKFLSPHRPGEPLVVHYDQDSQGKMHFEIWTVDRLIAMGSYF